MDNILIRELQAEDAEDVDRINKAIIKGDLKDDFKRLLEEYSGNEGSAGFVAEHEGRVVGYMIKRH